MLYKRREKRRKEERVTVGKGGKRNRKSKITGSDNFFDVLKGMRMKFLPLFKRNLSFKSVVTPTTG